MSRLLKFVFKPRELILKDGQIFVRYPDKPDRPVHKMVLYKYLIRDILYVNAFTPYGRVGFHHSLDSSYRIELDRHQIIKYALKADVEIKEKTFLFINHWLEKD